jgi:dCMP deaminase
MYLSWYPCADCARAIIQSGIVEVIGIEPDWDHPRWGTDFEVTRTLLYEAGVKVRFHA